jgi:hypothetical protein
MILKIEMYKIIHQLASEKVDIFHSDLLITTIKDTFNDGNERSMLYLLISFKKIVI